MDTRLESPMRDALWIPYVTMHCINTGLCYHRYSVEILVVYMINRINPGCQMSLMWNMKIIGWDLVMSVFYYHRIKIPLNLKYNLDLQITTSFHELTYFAHVIFQFLIKEIIWSTNFVQR